jgi:hypothetical protein
MDREEARRILAAYRPGDHDQTDPQFAEALKEAARDPELARWFGEEREFDRAIAAHLESVPVPLGLKTRILANAAPGAASKSSWAAALAVVAAVLFLLAQIVNLWRDSAHSFASLPDYQREMVSFIQLPPPLDMESSNLGEIKNWLAKKEVTQVAVPARLATLDPVGCRILSFRGRKVTLICFRRSEKNLAHLFVVDCAALPKLKPGASPVFADEGEWTTASWAEKDRVYMIAVQGGRDTAKRYLPDA